jgi:hypothetical protein
MKARKAAAKKAARVKARKAARKQRVREVRLGRQVLKGKMPVSLAQHKLGIQVPGPIVLPDATKAPEPEAAPPAVDAKTIAKAVKAAVKPLHAQIAAQDRGLRRLRKETERIAAQPDTSNAPFRGAALTKTASPAPAGPVTVADHVEHAKAARIRLLQDQMLNDPNPALREAARTGLMQELDLNIPPNTMRT